MPIGLKSVSVILLLVLRVITKNRVFITNHGEYWPLFFFFNFHCLKVRKNDGGHC